MNILLSTDYLNPKTRGFVVQKAFCSNKYCIIYPDEIKLLKKFKEVVIGSSDNETVNPPNRISMYQ